MSFPNNSLSPIPYPSEFDSADLKWRGLMLDYEIGGVALNDPSQGLLVQTWRARANEFGVWLDAENIHEPLLLFEYEGITEISLAFDQNMNTVIAFVAGGICYLRTWNPTTSQYVITSYGSTIRNPRVAMDDKRYLGSGYNANNDVIFAYLNSANKLCYRQQRENYSIEHNPINQPAGGIKALIKIGMGTGLRFQFQVEQL